MKLWMIKDSVKRKTWGLRFEVIPRLLGKHVRYWVLNYEGARNIAPEEEVPAVPFVTVLKRSCEKVI